jgi:RNA polymerase sigma-70 factor (ECF subfamily)
VQHSEQSIFSFPHAFGGRADSARLSLDGAFEALFTEHYPRLVKTLVRLTGNSGQAEELASDAFCKLYRRGPREDGANAAGWLYRTAINLGLDAVRSNARRLRREEKVSREAVFRAEGESPLSGLMAEEQRARVRAVLARLKPEHSQALLMVSSGFSCKEMAGVMGMKAESLYVLTGRARAKFEAEYVRLFGRQI